MDTDTALFYMRYRNGTIWPYPDGQADLHSEAINYYGYTARLAADQWAQLKPHCELSHNGKCWQISIADRSPVARLNARAYFGISLEEYNADYEFYNRVFKTVCPRVKLPMAELIHDDLAHRANYSTALSDETLMRLAHEDNLRSIRQS